MNYPEVYTDGTGTFKTTPTGTGLKIEQGGISFDGSAPVAGTLAGATIPTPTISNPILTFTPVNVTASTIALTAPLHANRTVTLNRAAGIAVTLPAATGTGNVYKLFVGTTFTGAATVKVASATDFIRGTAVLFQDAGDTVVGFVTANTGTVATESDTIDLLGTANSTGGIIGEIIELTDVASATWSLRLVSDAGGTEATPFSATV